MGAQLRIGAFLLGCGHHSAAWRHRDSPVESLGDITYYESLAQIAERGKLDAVFFADGHSVREPESGASWFLEPITALTACTSDSGHRPGDHHFHHFLHAVSRGATVGLARPHQRRAGRLERRDLDVRPGGAQPRTRGDARSRIPIRTSRRICRSGPRIVGFMVGRRADSRPVGAFCRRKQDFSNRSRRQTFSGGRAVDGSALPARPAGVVPGRGVRAGPRSGGASRRGNLFGCLRLTLRTGLLRGREIENRASRPGFELCRRDAGTGHLRRSTVAEARAKKAELDLLLPTEQSIRQLSLFTGQDCENWDLDGPVPPLPPLEAFTGPQGATPLFCGSSRRTHRLCGSSSGRSLRVVVTQR